MRRPRQVAGIRMRHERWVGWRSISPPCRPSSALRRRRRLQPWRNRGWSRRAAGAFLIARASIPFFISKVVVASLTLCVLGLEEEAAASHLEAVKLHCCLYNLEDCHEALAHAVLDAVRAVRPEGHLLPNHLWSLPR
jgi:hypothetical protein